MGLRSAHGSAAEVNGPVYMNSVDEDLLSRVNTVTGSDVVISLCWPTTQHVIANSLTFY